MEFSPANPIVKLCLQGMNEEDQNNIEAASRSFLQAWNAASQDFEKFIAAHYVARTRTTESDRLHWLDIALQYALGINDDSVTSALPALYANIAHCHAALGATDQAQHYEALATSTRANPTDKGPFYHGTRADLQVGDLLTPGGSSNYKPDLTMNHIYFTAMVNGAGLAAALAKGNRPERVYIVEPTGPFENDPNVTDKKFPGNPTRSYRSGAALKIVGEVTEWQRMPAEQLQQWRERVARIEGDIIN